MKVKEFNNIIYDKDDRTGIVLVEVILNVGKDLPHGLLARGLEPMGMGKVSDLSGLI
jgi:hypothetical protein